VTRQPNTTALPSACATFSKCRGTINTSELGPLSYFIIFVHSWHTHATHHSADVPFTLLRTLLQGEEPHIMSA